MKSSEFGKFPWHIALPNAWEPFWWQKVNNRKRFVTLWDTYVYLFEPRKTKEPLCHVKIWLIRGLTRRHGVFRNIW